MSVASASVERLDQDAAEIGSVFVSNYPPYSQWDYGVGRHGARGAAATRRP